VMSVTNSVPARKFYIEQMCFSAHAISQTCRHVVAENNSVGHSQHSSLTPCMTEPIVLRKQRSGKPSFWDVNDWEIYDQFVRHIRRERAKFLMQQNVLPRSLSTNNLLYLCDAKQATVNNYDKSNSDASAETEM